jgi:hypothetical protein
MGFFDFLSGIGTIFGDLASLINSLFIALWNLLLAVFQFLWDTLVTVVNAIVSVFKNVGSFFNRMWTDYLKPAIKGIGHAIQNLILHPIASLRKLMDWLHKIRRWYDTHVIANMQKQIQLIQKIRQLLTLLRILHVKWAQQLDDLLAKAQGKIAQNIEFIRGYLNLITSWIALVTDRSMIIRRNTLGAWLLSHVGGLKRIVGYGGNRPVTSAEQADMDKTAKRYHPDTVHDHVLALSLTGLTDDDQTERTEARAALSDAIGAPLPF